jgi:hypothetical protein
MGAELMQLLPQKIPVAPLASVVEIIGGNLNVEGRDEVPRPAWEFRTH